MSNKTSSTHQDNALFADRYYLTSTRYLSREDVLRAINEYISSADQPFFASLYAYLQEKFHVSYFNRRNLRGLISESYVIHKSGFLQSCDTIIPIVSENPIVIKKPNNSLLLRWITTKISKLYEDIYRHGINELNVGFCYDEFLSIQREIQQSENDSFSSSERLAFGHILLSELRNAYATTDVSKDQFLSAFLSVSKEYSEYSECCETMLKIDGSNDSISFNDLLPTSLVEKLHLTGIHTVADLKTGFDFQLYHLIVVEISNFSSILDGLTTNCRDYVKKTLQSILRDANYLRKIVVLTDRFDGLTLAAIGSKYNVSRERVRQIEVKSIKLLRAFILTAEGEIFLNVIRSNVENIHLVRLENVELIFDDLTKPFLHLISKINRPNCMYYAELGILNLSDTDWMRALNEEMDSFPSTMTYSEAATLSKAICDQYRLKGIVIDENVLLTLYDNKYLDQGDRYTIENLDLRERYRFIVKKHFKSGICIFKENDILDFRKKFHGEFPDMDISHLKNHAIESILMKATCLIGRGKYDVEERIPTISEDLAEEIREYVDAQGTVTLCTIVFETFRSKLHAFGITNRFLLNTVLRMRFDGYYYFKRDIISKERSNFNLFAEIDKAISRHPGTFTTDEINRLFPSVQANIVQHYLRANEKYIKVDAKTWISNENLHIEEFQWEGIRKSIEELLTTEKIISHKEIFNDTYSTYAILYEKNHIDNPSYLYGVLQYMFKDDFVFKRPFIAAKGTEIPKGIDLLFERVSKVQTIKFDEIKKWVDNYGIQHYVLNQFIDEISHDFLRIDYGLFVRKKTLGITKEISREMNEALDKILGSKSGVYAKLIRTKSFPILNYPWNSYFIASFVECYSKEFAILKKSNNFNYVKFILVRKGSAIKSYSDYIRLAKKANIGESDYTSF